MLREETDERAHTAIAAVLRYGSVLSALVMVIGVLLAFMEGGSAAQTAPLSAGALVMRAVALDPLAVTQLGILLLLLTPVFRIVIAVIAFGVERDYRYVLISSGVLIVVLASIAFALG
jgi:uncharacterized membrane protein